MHYLIKNLLNSRAGFSEIKSKVMMTKDGSTKVVNFMTPGAGFFC